MAEPWTMTELPAQVTLHKAEIANPRFTPRELRLIKEQTGATLSTLLGDESGDEKFVVFGWLKLRREGHELDLADMDDVVLSFDFAGDVVADPTSGQLPTT